MSDLPPPGQTPGATPPRRPLEPPPPPAPHEATVMRPSDQVAAPPPAPDDPGSRTSRGDRGRRWVVLVVLVLVVAGGAVAAFAVLGGEDDAAGDHDHWNAIVVLDADTNTVEIRDADGVTVDEVEVTVDDANSLSVRGRYALVMHDADDDSDKRAAVVDLADASATTIENPTSSSMDSLDDNWSLDWVPGSHEPVLLEANSSGGDDISYRMTDVASGETAEFDVPVSTAENVTGTSDGRRLLLYPNGSWTTIAGIGLDDTDLLQGASVASVTDDVVITESKGQYFVYDAATGSSDDRSFITPDAIAVHPDGDDTLVVDGNGHLLRASADGDDPVDVADLGFSKEQAPGNVFFLPAIDRIVLMFDDKAELIAYDGSEIATIEGTATAAANDPAAGRCFLTYDDDNVQLIDGESGEVVVESTTESAGSVTASNDGCTVAHESPDGPEVLATSGDGEPIALDNPAATMAPDGAVVVIRNDDDEWEIVDVADPDGGDEPVTFVGDSLAFGSR